MSDRNGLYIRRNPKKSDSQREIELFRAQYGELVRGYVSCGFSDAQQRQRETRPPFRAKSRIEKKLVSRFALTMYREINPLRTSAVLIRERVTPTTDESQFGKEIHGNRGKLNANFSVLSLADRVSKLLRESRIVERNFLSFRTIDERILLFQNRLILSTLYLQR